MRPNAGVAFGYEAHLLMTSDGTPHLGFLLSDGETVAMRDGYGRTVVFERDRVAGRTPIKASLMPDPLALGMSEQDVADAAAFLMAGPHASQVKP